MGLSGCLNVTMSLCAITSSHSAVVWKQTHMHTHTELADWKSCGQHDRCLNIILKVNPSCLTPRQQRRAYQADTRLI